jgi:hypothetical protein
MKMTDTKCTFKRFEGFTKAELMELCEMNDIINVPKSTPVIDLKKILDGIDPAQFTIGDKYREKMNNNIHTQQEDAKSPGASDQKSEPSTDEDKNIFREKINQFLEDVEKLSAGAKSFEEMVDSVTNMVDDISTSAGMFVSDKDQSPEDSKLIDDVFH